MHLCKSHQIARNAMFQQAGLSKNAATLVPELQHMEQHSKNEFLEHLECFGDMCLLLKYECMPFRMRYNNMYGMN